MRSYWPRGVLNKSNQGFTEAEKYNNIPSHSLLKKRGKNREKRSARNQGMQNITADNFFFFFFLIFLAWLEGR
jgi:hypothetical protein